MGNPDVGVSSTWIVSPPLGNTDGVRREDDSCVGS